MTRRGGERDRTDDPIARLDERSRGLVERRPGGHDIVHHQHGSTVATPTGGHAAPDVRGSRPGIEAALIRPTCD